MTEIDDAVEAVFASGVLSSCERDGDTAVIGCRCYDEIDRINVRELVTAMNRSDISVISKLTAERNAANREIVSLRAELAAANSRVGDVLGSVIALRAAADAAGVLVNEIQRSNDVRARQDAEKIARMRLALEGMLRYAEDHDDRDGASRASDPPEWEAAERALDCRPKVEAKREPRHGPYHHVTQAEKDMCQVCYEDDASRPQGEKS